MTYLGLHQLGTASGSSRDPHPDRTADLADLFGQLTSLNWGAFIVFSLCALATHQRRWQLRHTVKGSAA